MNEKITYEQALAYAKEYLDSVEIVNVLEGASSQIYTRRDISQTRADHARSMLQNSFNFTAIFAEALVNSSKVAEAVDICEQIADEYVGTWRAAANKCAARIRRILIP